MSQEVQFVAATETASSLRPLPAAALLAPLTILMLAIFVHPLLTTAWTSIHPGHFSPQAYADLLTSTLFLKVLRSTASIAISSTLVSLLVGLPVALHLAGLPPRRRMACLVLVMLPFWTSILVKSFALIVIFGNQGLINRLLGLLSDGAVNIPMMFNRVGVVIGMINYLLPFMILSILGSLLAQDPALIRAAETMGAGQWRILWRVVLPLCMPGIVAGVLIDMTLAIGMYITPALLGGRQDMMMANLVDFYTRQTLDWTTASAIAIVLLAISGALVALLGRVRGAGGTLEAIG